MSNSSLIQQTSDASFENDLLKSNKLVLVDFWAEWCGPCKLLAPTLEKIAEKFQGKLSVLKLEVDQNPNVAVRYQIKGIPTIIFFRSGTMVDQIVGNQPYNVLEVKIENLLAH
jgi:thioredoxin 1